MLRARHCCGARVGVFGLCLSLQGLGCPQAREPLRLFFRLLMWAFRMGAGSSPSSVVYSIPRPLKEGGVQSIFGGWGGDAKGGSRVGVFALECADLVGH